MPPARVEAQRHRGFIFIADLFWVWWWFDFFFSLLWVHLHLRSSSPICSGFGGGLIFFFLPWVHPHRRSVLGLVVVWFFFSCRGFIFIAYLFWVWWLFDFWFFFSCRGLWLSHRGCCWWSGGGGRCGWRKGLCDGCSWLSLWTMPIINLWCFFSWKYYFIIINILFYYTKRENKFTIAEWSVKWESKIDKIVFLESNC